MQVHVNGWLRGPVRLGGAVIRDVERMIAIGIGSFTSYPYSGAALIMGTQRESPPPKESAR